jgi:thiamine-monophosphate kinase
MKLGEIGEFGFIERIVPYGNIRAEGVVKAIGDDCAVISVGGPDYLLVTTDLLVERVHFLMEWAPAEVIGAKALAVNLSDIAACGGSPLDAFISLAVPDRVDVAWLDGLYRGMGDMARAFEVNLLGGDTTGSRGDLTINVAVTGRVPRDEILFRHTANPGDIIVITGPLGDSGAGLEILLDSPELPSELRQPLVRAHLEPRPHVREGRSLASSDWCTAAIDVSDGLSSDLGHLCIDSGLGAVVHEDKIPVGEALMRAARALGRDPLDWILNGGEDYVLLAGLKPEMVKSLEDRASDEGWSFSVIGEFSEGKEMRVVRRDGSIELFAPGGWDHFKEPKE